MAIPDTRLFAAQLHKQFSLDLLNTAELMLEYNDPFIDKTIEQEGLLNQLVQRHIELGDIRGAYRVANLIYNKGFSTKEASSVIAKADLKAVKLSAAEASRRLQNIARRFSDYCNNRV